MTDYISEIISASAVYYTKDPPYGEYDDGFKTNIVVFSGTVQEALWEHRNIPLAVLSFACARNPAGKTKYSRRGQEMDLYSISNLSDVMNTMQIAAMFYVPNRTNNTFCSDRVLYTPNICFTMNGDSFFADVISSAAPCVKFLTNVSDNKLRVLLEQRIDMILNSALIHNKRNIILGAWGCGGNGIDPTIVATAFKTVIDTAYNGVFENIIFAIPDSNLNNYYIFKTIIGGDALE